MASVGTGGEVPDGHSQQAHTSLRLQLMILGLFRFSEALAWTTIFPYVFFMMKSFLMHSPERDAKAAVYASATVALFTFGEFLTGIVWATISDRLGRKPTLLIGVLGGSISALAFGLSRTLWMALGARAFGGLVNPNVGVISACVGELVKKSEHQGKAFSSVSFLRALGALIGPVIGGHLAEPVKIMPSIFHKNSIYGTFPYLLPNLVVVLFIMASGFLGFFFLEESHPEKQNQPDIGRKMAIWLRGKITRLLGHSDSSKYVILDTNEHAIHLTDRNGAGDEESFKAMDFRLHNQIILQILTVSLLAFHKVSSDVIVPTFLAFRSIEGNKERSLFKFKAGFGMTSSAIANALLTQAVVATFSQILVVPRVLEKFGPLRTYRYVLVAFPFLYCVTPFTARFEYPLSYAAILFDIWIRCILFNLGYICSSVLLTNTTPAPEHLATVNGAAASIGCLARSVGALVSGSMFHVGLASGYIGIPFWTLSVVAGIGVILSWFLRETS
ncbi:MFS multidrug transporter [Xylogone sp. PMI_703]|nr:MFS multidrug transporter [Xylogone sp. PMI_703]